MFTKPNSPTRPRVASRPRTPQPNARGAAGADSRKKAQDELERLLQRLGHRAEAPRPAGPSAARARPARAEGRNPATKREPTFAPPQMPAHNPASRSAGAHARPSVPSSLPQSTQTAIERKLLEHKAALVIMAVLIALALALAVIGQAVASAGIERVAGTLGLHANKIASLEGQQTELAASTKRRLDAMQVSLAEVKYPPSEFGEAGDLFKAGRYADAESAYHAFLLRNPNSRLADKALHNAAVAAAMRNNCGMADSYVKQLQLKFPKSPFAASANNLGPQCRAVRSSL